MLHAAAGRELNPAHEIIRVLDREAAPYLVHRWLWTTQALFTNLAWSAEALVNALVSAVAMLGSAPLSGLSDRIGRRRLLHAAAAASLWPALGLQAQTPGAASAPSRRLAAP